MGAPKKKTVRPTGETPNMTRLSRRNQQLVSPHHCWATFCPSFLSFFPISSACTLSAKQVGGAGVVSEHLEGWGVSQT